MTIEKTLFGSVARFAEEKREQKYMTILFS